MTDHELRLQALEARATDAESKLAEASEAAEQQASAAEALESELSEVRRRVEKLEEQMRTHKHGYVPPPRY